MLQMQQLYAFLDLRRFKMSDLNSGKRFCSFSTSTPVICDTFLLIGGSSENTNRNESEN